jgi:hypothetical protein
MRLKTILSRSDASFKENKAQYINLNYYVTVPPTKFDLNLNNPSVSLGLRVIYTVEFANELEKFGIHYFN